MNYEEFLERKTQTGNDFGFAPVFVPKELYDFQRNLLEFALKKGRAAVFADCGMGKTLLQLSWAENIIRKENKPVLILAPLAVGGQTVKEGEKFGIKVHRSKDGKIKPGINITNYESLHHFNRNDFIGVACDESSILKHFRGATQQAVTEFMMKTPYRSLWTATAAPNDFIELGTSSEVLGQLGNMDMLNRFFKNDTNNSAIGRKYGEVVKWRFKGHAELAFWRWICSWSRAMRRPSDLGFEDGKFKLKPLIENYHLVESKQNRDGMLFNMPAAGLFEQKEERRITIKDRCEKVAELVNKTGAPALIWCHLNEEGDLLEKIIPDCIQVSGKDSDEEKEEKFMAFSEKQTRILVSKQKIGGWGMNWQHCPHVVSFVSHSFEQYYQGVRRCWRYGQEKTVISDIVLSEGEKSIMENLKRKAAQAEKMFNSIVSEMSNAVKIDKDSAYIKREEVPTWL